MNPRRAVVLLTFAATAGLPAPTYAGPPAAGPQGRLCAYSASPDPSPEASDDAMTGQVNAGPATGGFDGTLVCTIRLNVNAHAAGGQVASFWCPADSNGVIACATTVNYTADAHEPSFMCASFRRQDGVLVYWHPRDYKQVTPFDDEPGHWTTDAATPCELRGPVRIDH